MANSRSVHGPGFVSHINPCQQCDRPKSCRDKEPVGITIVKIIGALLLVLVALAFGAGGACGAWVAVQGLGEAIRSRSAGSSGGIWLIGAICAFVGLGVAGLLVWGAVAIFRERDDRRE